MKIRVASLTVVVLALLSTPHACAETFVLSSPDTRLVLAFPGSYIGGAGAFAGWLAASPATVRRLD